MMLSGPIVPMEPVSGDEAFDDPKFTFEVKWDGVRMLAFCGPDHIRLQNRRTNDRTLQYPELQILSRLLLGKTAILDGEVVAFSKGKPNFFSVMERDSCRSPERVSTRARSIPVHFMVFDILHWDGKDVTGLSLSERKHLLCRALANQGDSIHTVEGYPGRGVALYEATRQQGLEGIVGKSVRSPYVMGGKKSAYWVKVKHKKRQLCAVCGYSIGAGGFISILAGVTVGDVLTFVGKVGSGLTGSVSQQLLSVLGEAEMPKSPFPYTPSLSGVHWVTPQLTFICEFLGWTEDLRMRAPVFIGFTGEPPDRAAI